MRAICAWCADGRGTAASEADVVRSHGLCAPCLAARLDALRAIAPSADRVAIAKRAEQDAA